MKKLLLTSLAAAALLFPAVAHADSYKFDPNHTSVWWQANHFGFSNPMGRFGIQDGTLTLDEKNPANSSVDVTIDIKSLATGVDKFTEHLESDAFFDAAKYPTAEFKSTSVKLLGSDAATPDGGGQKADVTGNLTLHGVTKPVTLHVTLNKIGEHPMTHKKAAGFSATATIKRSDFGMTSYIPGVSDEVHLDIEAEGQAQ
jgi:polyisoprenoid-binding protein YceI